MQPLDDILNMAKDLLKKYNLHNWTVQYVDRNNILDKSSNNSYDVFGKTDYNAMTISLSSELTLYEKDMNRITNTILHEIAHAIDYEKRGFSDHGTEWQEIAKSIGCNANQQTSNKTLDQEKLYKYKAVCNNCGTKYFSRNKVTTNRSCSVCGGAKYNSKYILKYTFNSKLIKTYEQFLVYL